LDDSVNTQLSPLLHSQYNLIVSKQ